jgi:hypothetical protein
MRASVLGPEFFDVEHHPDSHFAPDLAIAAELSPVI